MKTDNLMKVAFPNGTLDIYHLSQMGSLSDVFKLGNKYRVMNDKSVMRLNSFMEKESTKDFIKSAMNKGNIHVGKVFYKRGKNKNTIYYGNLHLIIYCAEMLSSDFHYDIIDIFIKDNILKLRDDGGNDFKALNDWLVKMPSRKDKPNRGMIIQIASQLRAKIFSEEVIKKFHEEYEGKKIIIWNSKYAGTREHNLRAKYEEYFIFAIKMGYIQSYEDMKRDIEKL